MGTACLCATWCQPGRRSGAGGPIAKRAHGHGCGCWLGAGGRGPHASMLGLPLTWQLASQSKCPFPKVWAWTLAPCHFCHVLLVRSSPAQIQGEGPDLTSRWEKHGRIWGPCFQTAGAHETWGDFQERYFLPQRDISLTESQLRAQRKK